MTVYAQWTTTPPGSYAVTFMLDDGTEAVLTVKYPAAGTAIPSGDFPTPPSRTGYNFGGWYTGQNGGGIEFTASTTVSGNIPVYARWLNTTITLNPVAGDGAFCQGIFTLSKSGTGNPDSQVVTLTGTGYTNPRWVVDGIPKGSLTGITYSSVSGDAWTLESDGRRRSPVISDGSTTKERVSFTSPDNATITVQLDVSSSESNYNYAFISTLDNGSATYYNGYYTGSFISGTTSVTVTIPIPTAGSHFIEIGYWKNGPNSSGSDCAWFKVDEPPPSNAITIHAADYGIGGHNLTLLIIKNGVTWSKDIAFTVTN
jgi:uncharacterized repeat protein (TIGR02543 family)